METMKLEQLIQATSGLSNRKETPVLVNGQPITEIRISMRSVPSHARLFRKSRMGWYLFSFATIPMAVSIFFSLVSP